MQVNSDDSAGVSIETKVQAQKKLVEELKAQWKQLWSERLNDKVRAEDISGSNYECLQVERGTIIHASRDFKPLNFKEVLEQHKVANPEAYVAPSVEVGGWTKFAKKEIIAQAKQQRTASQRNQPVSKKAALQSKKGGRGWLHKK